jgi:beta-ureidopropionase
VKTVVAAVQLAVTDDRDVNLGAAERLVRDAAAVGATVVVLPEIFAAPFVGPVPDLDYFRWAEAPDGPSNTMVRALSEELAVTVLSPIFEQAAVPGVHHNSVYTYSSGQLVSVYRKSHLPFSNAFPEKFYFRPGDEAPTAFSVGELRVGTIICYERHFPELGRLVALAGAHVMCVPVACASEPTKEVFQLELRAHAAFNSMYVACANRVGAEGAKRYYGTSGIYGPDGTPLAVAGDQPGVVAAEVDTEAVIRRRLVLPFLRDRRPDLYRGLTQPG